MVDIASNAPSSPLRITVRPNCALSRHEHVVLLLVIVPFALAIGLVFSLLGAWLVVPFVAIALIALAAAFHAVRRHADDFEQITLADDRLLVDRHQPDGDEHFEFNGHWVQVISHRDPSGGCDYLALRSHGREIVLGRALTDAERACVGEALRTRLAWMRR